MLHPTVQSQPASLKKRWLFQISLIFLLTLSIALFAPGKVHAAGISSSELYELTNQERAKSSLTALDSNAGLESAAIDKANMMLAQNCWAHICPGGSTPWQFIENSGYEFALAGENLAMDFTSPEAVMSGWMNSPTHRQNVLETRYKDIGIAVVEGSLQGHDTLLVVALYAQPTNPPASVPKAIPAKTTVVEPTKSTTSVKPKGSAKPIQSPAADTTASQAPNRRSQDSSAPWFAGLAISYTSLMLATASRAIATKHG